MYKAEKSVKNTDNSDIQNKYLELFHGIGCLPGKYQMHIDHNVTHVVHPPRQLPISASDKVEQ